MHLLVGEATHVVRVVDEGICRQAILGHVTVCTSDKLAASVVAVVAWKKNKKRKEKGGSSRSVGVWVGREKGRGREGKRNRKREKDTHTHTPKKPHTHTHTHTHKGTCTYAHGVFAWAPTWW